MLYCNYMGFLSAKETVRLRSRPRSDLYQGYTYGAMNAADYSHSYVVQQRQLFYLSCLNRLEAVQ